MSGFALLLFYLFLALGVSFACSVFEAVLLSVRRTYVRRLRAEGAWGAATWDRLLRRRSRALAAILILNTVAHTVGAVGVGAQAGIVFNSIPVSVISAVLTILILVVSEIIPKTLGASYARRLAPVCGVLIDGLTRIMLPLVWVSEKITAVFERKDRSSGLSRAEVAATVELGHDEGALGRLESKIMRNLTRLQSMRVVDIMTPRTVIFMVPQITTVGEYLERHADMPFSRIPIHAEDPDDLTGFVLKSEILLARAEGHVDWPLSRLRRDLEEIPETAPVWSTFEQFIGAREHIRSVRDEYGGLAGVVTLEDVVETLLGMEIVDEADVDVDMREKARKLWQQRARRMGIETGEQA